jgi:hypothetical protein
MAAGNEPDVEKAIAGSLMPAVPGFVVAMPDGTEVIATIAADSCSTTPVKNLHPDGETMAKLWCPFRRNHC